MHGISRYSVRSQQLPRYSPTKRKLISSVQLVAHKYLSKTVIKQAVTCQSLRLLKIGITETRREGSHTNVRGDVREFELYNLIMNSDNEKKNFSLPLPHLLNINFSLPLPHRNFVLVKLILKDPGDPLLNIGRDYVWDLYLSEKCRAKISTECSISIVTFILIIQSLSCSTNMDVCMRLVKNTASSIAPNAATWTHDIKLSR